MFKEIDLFKNRKFLRLWVSHVLSQLSGYGLLFLVISKTFELTTSSVITGIVYISFSLPIIFISPFSGSLVDAWAKRKTLIYTYLGHFLIILLIAASYFAGKHDLIYLLLFFFSAVTTINDPAELAQLPDLISEKEDLLVANNIIFFSDQTALIVSSTLAGLMVKVLDLPLTLVLIGLMPLAASFIIAGLPQKKAKKEPLSLLNEIGTLIANLKSGYKFLTENRLVVYSFGLVVLFRVFTSVSVLLLPNIAKNIFNISVFDAGYFIVLPVAVGLIIGTIILNRLKKDTRKNQWIGSGFFLMGIAILAVIFGRQNNQLIQTFLDLIYLVFIGASASVIFSPSLTFLQEFTPDRVRGYTFSNLMFFVHLAIIPSSLFATSLAEVLGIKILLGLIAILVLCLGFLIINKGNEIILATNHRS